MIDALLLLARNKRLVVWLPIAAAALAAIVSLFLPNIYTATARILPPQQNASMAAALLAQLGNLGQIASQTAGLKNPSDLYVGMLQSRTIADNIIKRFHLQSLYDKETLVDTRKALANRTTIFSGRDGLIAIEFEDEDPVRAASIANAYIEELQNLSQTLAVTEASQRRLFFEKQLAQTRSDLTSAEIAFQKVQEKTGLLKLDGQSQAIIESVASLRAEIASKEVQLETMRTFSTSTNPDLIRAGSQLSALREQLSKLERGAAATQGSVFVPTGRIPQVGLEYVRTLRDLKYQEALFELMAKQFEIAKIDEARDMGIIQVLDAAIPPDKKSWPKRSLIVVATFIVVLLVGVLAVLVKEVHEQALLDPTLSSKYQTFLNLVFGFLRR
jgi:uncharacterized protein involved in exopolysaccharide biosynthesis